MAARRSSRVLVLAVAGIALLSLTGCFGVDGKFTGLRSMVTEQTGVSISNTEFEFRVGGLILGLASKVIGWSKDPDSGQVQYLLKQIRGVQIGVYRLHSFRPEHQQVYPLSQHLIRHVQHYDFDPIIRNYGPDGLGLVMVKTDQERPNRISELVVLKANTDQLIIVHLEGDVNEIVEIATRERGVPGVEMITDT